MPAPAGSAPASCVDAYLLGRRVEMKSDASLADGAFDTVSRNPEYIAIAEK